MKTYFKKHLTVVFITSAILFTSGCTVLKTEQPTVINCLVCGMKVDKAEAYTYKYKDTKYYFDNYNCKQTFKMNPEKFINNPCEKKIK